MEKKMEKIERAAKAEKAYYDSLDELVEARKHRESVRFRLLCEIEILWDGDEESFNNYRMFELAKNAKDADKKYQEALHRNNYLYDLREKARDEANAE